MATKKKTNKKTVGGFFKGLNVREKLIVFGVVFALVGGFVVFTSYAAYVSFSHTGNQLSGGTRTGSGVMLTGGTTTASASTTISASELPGIRSFCAVVTPTKLSSASNAVFLTIAVRPAPGRGNPNQSRTFYVDGRYAPVKPTIGVSQSYCAPYPFDITQSATVSVDIVGSGNEALLTAVTGSGSTGGGFFGGGRRPSNFPSF